MSVSTFPQYASFIQKSDALFRGLPPQKIKEEYPIHCRVRGQVNSAAKTVFDSLEGWKATPRGTFGGVRKMFNSFLKVIRIRKNDLDPKDQAANSYQFQVVGDEEKEGLKKRAGLYKTLAKVALVVGVVLLCVGIFGPLGIIPLLFALPEAAALSVIIGSTAIGVVGAVSLIANPILKNSRAIREERVKTDEDFKEFINTFVQGSGLPKKHGIDFKLKEEDLMDSKLHKIFLTWKEAIDTVLPEKVKEKLEEEVPLTSITVT